MTWRLAVGALGDYDPRVDLPEGYRCVRDGICRAVLRVDRAETSLDLLWATGTALPGVKGRGGVQTLLLDGGLGVVMRDYQRGGAMGWFLTFWFVDGQRAARELDVLARLHAAGVPVVVPVAALSRRVFGLNRLRLVTEWVKDAVPLPAFVAAHPDLRHRAIGEAGRVVRMAFDQGLVHRDLHPDNMVVRCGADGPEVLLLDLDRASLVAELSLVQRDKMLMRMLRYLERHAATLAALTQATDIMRFLRGYGLGVDERRALVEDLLPAYRRSVARHRLSW